MTLKVEGVDDLTDDWQAKIFLPTCISVLKLAPFFCRSSRFFKVTFRGGRTKGWTYIRTNVHQHCITALHSSTPSERSKTLMFQFFDIAGKIKERSKLPLNVIFNNINIVLSTMSGHFD